MVRPRGSQILLEERRKKALLLLKKGFSVTEVASRVGAAIRSVRRWKALYRKDGVNGLKSRPIPGRPKRG